jgi:hypothetical protein
LANPDRDRQLLIELHEVGRDRRIRPARARLLAAVEPQLDAFGGRCRGDSERLVGQRLDFFA